MTLVRSLSSVCTHVNLKMAWLTKLLRTLRALKGLFTSMGPYMRAQSWRVRKPLGAKPTLKWFFSIMNSQMQGQVARLAECLGALGALIWLFTSMNAHVSGQVTWLVEGFVTMWTWEWLLPSMSSEVRRQRGGRWIFLWTHRALERIDFWMAAKMWGKFTWTGKLFMALRTLQYVILLLLNNTFLWPHTDLHVCVYRNAT